MLATSTDRCYCKHPSDQTHAVLPAAAAVSLAFGLSVCRAHGRGIPTRVHTCLMIHSLPQSVFMSQAGMGKSKRT